MGRSPGRIFKSALSNAFTFCLKCRPSWQCILAVLLVIPHFSISAPKNSFEVSGLLVYTGYAPDQRVKAHAQRLFQVSVSNSFWNINSFDPSNQHPYEPTNGPLYQEVGTDSTNHFVVTSFVRNRADGTQEGASLGGINVASAGIVPGIVPRDNGSFASFLWLAFGSSSYLDSRQGKGSLRPPWAADDHSLELTDYTLPAEWTRSPTAPFLPQKIEFFKDNNNEPSGLGTSKPNQAPPRAVRARFVNYAFTNISGLSIPTSFSFTRYYGAYVGAKAPSIFITVTGQVDQVSTTITAKSFKPILPGLTFIGDERFRATVGGLIPTYFSEDWKTDEEVVEMEKYRRIKATLPFPTSFPPSHKSP